MSSNLSLSEGIIVSPPRMSGIKECHLGPSSASGEIAVFACSVTAISRLRCAALEIITFKHTTINENVL